MRSGLICSIFMALLSHGAWAGGVYTSSSFSNSSDTSGNASAHLEGQNLRVLDMSSGASLHLQGDPNIDAPYFKLRFDLGGNFLSGDELPPGGSGGGGGGGNSGHLNISHVTAYGENGESEMYQFSPPLVLDWSSSSWFQFNDWDQTWSGGMDTYAWTEGGRITSASINFWENEWTEEDPPPGWWRDWNASVNIDGIITATNFTPVPEPATAGLMGLGAVALLRKRRHR